MKIEKSNNPAAAGALTLVLVLIVGRIGWMLFGHGQSASAASTVAATPPPSATAPAAAIVSIPAAAALPTPDADRPAPEATPHTTRNPFTSSVRLAPARSDSGHASPEHEAAGMTAARSVAAMPISPLPPLSVRAMSIAPRPVALDKQMALGKSAATDPLQALKLTAIVGGTEPLAVVETAQTEPVILHVGDRLAGMRVVAIDDHAVVFARGGERWTLPLQSAVDDVAAGSVSVTSVAAPQEKTDEQQNTDE